MQNSRIDVCVVGMGYIGLPTAVFLANSGMFVVGVDIDPERLRMVDSANAPFQEQGLENLLSRARESGMLTTSAKVVRANTFIVAVPTPLKEDKTADLSFVFSAISEIASVLVGGELIILESTCPPGTTHEVASVVKGIRPDLVFDDSTGAVQFAYCPERVLPGNMITEFVENSRIVGGISDSAARRAARLYQKVCRGGVQQTDANTAELAKLAENTFRDLNIAFANELSIIASDWDVNPWKLIALANLHPRVNILKPGIGVGGHCIAVDPWFLAQENPDDSKLIVAGRKANERKTEWVTSQIVSKIKENSSCRVMIWGLAFKPDVEDLRESPAVQIVQRVAYEAPDTELIVLEPFITQLPNALSTNENVELIRKFECVNWPDYLHVFLVRHSQFGETLSNEWTGDRSNSLDFVGILDEIDLT